MLDVDGDMGVQSFVNNDSLFLLHILGNMVVLDSSSKVTFSTYVSCDDMASIYQQDKLTNTTYTTPHSSPNVQQ